jgi:SulP family sulfate permease
VVTLLLNSFAGANIKTIGSVYGKIEAGFYPPEFSAIGNINFGALIVPAIVIAFLCAIESLLSATVASGMTGDKFNPNQELIGQGAANIFSSLVGGLPATGAIARTAAGIENGARSPLTGMFHAVFVLIMYFALMGVMGYVPLTVFSAILISVAINMSRFPLFIKFAKFGVRDVIILIVTCVLTIVFDLTYGVLGGVAVTFIVNAKNIFIGLKIQDEEGDAATIRLDGVLYFITANKLVNVVEKKFETCDKVIVDMSSVISVDETALEKLAGLNKKSKVANKEVEFVNYNEKIASRFEKYFKVL